MTFRIYREDGDTEFMNVLGNELVPKVWNWNHCEVLFPFLVRPQGVFVFVTVGGEKGVGHFLLAGNEEDVSKHGPKSAIFVTSP